MTVAGRPPDRVLGERVVIAPDEVVVGGALLGLGEDGQVHDRSDLRTALVSAPDALQFRVAQLGDGYKRLWDACDRLRGYADCWAHAQVARGAIDALVEPWLNVWDIRATQVLIEEAGGKQIVRPSAKPGALDAIIGSAALVDQIADILEF